MNPPHQPRPHLHETTDATVHPRILQQHHTATESADNTEVRPTARTLPATDLAGPRRGRPGGPARISGTDRPGVGLVPRTSLDTPWDRVKLNVTTPAPLDPTATPSPRPLPDPGPWAAALARNSIEALLGCRPTAQLQRWMTPELYEALRRRAGLAVRVNGRPRERRVPVILSHHAQELAGGRAVEATTVLFDGTRVRAAAVRLEAFRGRWRAVAMEIG